MTAPLATIAHTYLQVICEPGVDIYLNGERQGSSNWADGGLHLKISPDDYHVEAKKAGYKSQSTTISLKKSDVKVWELKPFTPLTEQATAKSPPQQAVQHKSGSLTIYSKPNECEITLINVSGSQASWMKKEKRWQAQKIPSGKYTVKTKALGKILSYDIQIHPAEGAILYFDFSAGAASLRKVFKHADAN